MMMMMSLSYFALFFALLTQAGQSSTVDSESLLRRDVANWTEIARSPLRLRRDFLAPNGDENAPLSERMHVFGTIVDKESEFVRCEGVLLSDRIVLTVSKCFENPLSKKRIDAKTLAFRFLQSTFSIEKYSFQDDFPFSVALLKESTQSTHVPHAYAFPMWTGAWQTKDTDWLILPELLNSHPYQLSSYYTATNKLKEDISNALKSCQFADRANMIALRCVHNFAIRNGASFFRQITNNPLTRAVAVPALVFKDASESCAMSKSHTKVLSLFSFFKPVNSVYYCGPRFTYDHARIIITEANKLGSGVSVSDLDVIPNGRICKQLQFF